MRGVGMDLRGCKNGAGIMADWFLGAVRSE